MSYMRTQLLALVCRRYLTRLCLPRRPLSWQRRIVRSLRTERFGRPSWSGRCGSLAWLNNVLNPDIYDIICHANVEYFSPADALHGA